MSSDLEAAMSETTSSNDLGKLAFSDDPAVREAVLANPNTPDWALRRIASDSRLKLESETPMPDPRAQGTQTTVQRTPLLSTNSSAAALRDAREKAHSLNGIAGFVAALGVTGGVILALAGLVVAANDAVQVGVMLIASGLVGILFWLLIGTFAQTVAQAVLAWVSATEAQRQ